jgi:hypothetical protein
MNDDCPGASVPAAPRDQLDPMIPVSFTVLSSFHSCSNDFVSTGSLPFQPEPNRRSAAIEAEKVILY